MRLIDISQPLGTTTAVWPGDQPFALDWSMRRDRGDSVDVAAVTLSVHTGTHADGPRHVTEGPGAGALSLEPFYGPAVVVDARPFVTGDPALVGPEALDGLESETTRVLFRTRDRPDAAVFPESFPALSPALARRVVDAGLVLLGTDAPSVDPVDSKTLECHHILADGGVAHVENLALSGVEVGRYLFIGLPLRLEEADSSPIRAALVRE